MTDAPNGTVIQRNAPRRDLLAFGIKDKITKSDMEWMSSITDDAMRTYGKIDMLLIMNYEDSDAECQTQRDANDVKSRSV